MQKGMITIVCLITIDFCWSYIILFIGNYKFINGLPVMLL